MNHIQILHFSCTSFTRSSRLSFILSKNKNNYWNPTIPRGVSVFPARRVFAFRTWKRTGSDGLKLVLKYDAHVDFLNFAGAYLRMKSLLPILNSSLFSIGVPTAAPCLVMSGSRSFPEPVTRWWPLLMIVSTALSSMFDRPISQVKFEKPRIVCVERLKVYSYGTTVSAAVWRTAVHNCRYNYCFSRTTIERCSGNTLFFFFFT